MPDKKISELPFGQLDSNSIIPIVSNGITSQTTFGYLASQVSEINPNMDIFTTGGATTPVPSGGEGTIVFDSVNKNFFGWTGTIWKQLSL